MEQNFKNHIRLVPGFHYFGYLVWLSLLGGSIYFLTKAGDNDRLPAILLVLASVNLLVLMWFSRAFALKAQDRAIRAEETLRYFMLTGHRPPALKMGQFIALRFASDEEMPALAQRAVTEQMSNADIKKAIRNWRPDHKRV